MLARLVEYKSGWKSLIRSVSSMGSGLNDSDLIMAVRRSNENRYSVYDKNANAIIKALQNGEYKVVNELAKISNINGHDKHENTPLTDAAKRGDNFAINYLVTKLGASLHMSCDCPHNKTPIHYAAEYGRNESVALLLKLGSNPNILDSRSYTPLDIAKNNTIKTLLINAGGCKGNQVPSHKIVLPRKGSCNLISD